MSAAAPWLDTPAWHVAVADFEDGSQHFAVVDPANEDEIVALTGRAEPEAKDREKAEKTAQLIAAVPTTSAFVQHALQLLEDLVRQYPEGPSNQTPAGAAARQTLALARQLQMHTPNPTPKGPTK